MKKLILLTLILVPFIINGQPKRLIDLPLKASNIALTDKFYIWDASSTGILKQITYATFAVNIRDTAAILRKSLSDTSRTLRTLIAGVGTNAWTRSGSNVYPNLITYKVGIGMTSPGVPLDVIGDIRTSTTIRAGQASILDANNNVAISGGSIANNGSYNVFVGFNSGSSIYTGIRNVATGNNSFLSLNTGSFNVALGDNAGIQTTSGSNNVFIGESAGYFNNSGSSNVFIGYYTGFNETNSNRLYIANSSTSSPLIWGNFSTSRVKINGSATITDTLVVASHGIKFSDGSIQTTSAALSLFGVTENGPSFKTYLGYNAGVSATGYSNTLIGSLAGVNLTTGQANSYLGAKAGYSTTTGHHNVFIGDSAGYSNVTGIANTSVGSFAGVDNNSLSNVFIGSSSGVHNTGNQNVVIGVSAGGMSGGSSGSVFVGYSAGYNETGSNKLYISNSSTATPLIGGDFSAKTVTINGSQMVTDSTGFPDGGYMTKAIRRASKIITSAQIIAGDTVLITPAPGAGKYIHVISLAAKKHYVTDYTTHSGYLIIKYMNNGGFTYLEKLLYNLTGVSGMAYADMSTIMGPYMTYVSNQPLKMFFSSTFLGGTSTLEVVVYYTIETF